MKTEIKKSNILGIDFYHLDIHQAVDVVEGYIRNQSCSQVNFSNAQTVSLCRNKQGFFELLNNSSLTLADGMSIVWASKWLGPKLPGRVAGPDFMENMCARAAEKGYSVFLLGTTDENLKILESKLRLKWPHLKIVGTYSPPMRSEFTDGDNESMIARVRKAKPDVLFVGLSCPKQEIWIAQNLKKLNVPVALGVGAAFNFLSGQLSRAPLFMQKIGMEWLYRFLTEPKRMWKRYVIGNSIFIFLFFREIYKNRLLGRTI